MVLFKMISNIGNIENLDVEKVNECRKKFRKLNNVLSEIHSEKSNVVYVFGSNENEILEKLNEYGLNKENIVSIGYGGYIHKDNVEQFKNLNKYIKGVKNSFANKNYYNACGIYLDSLWNFECRYSMDYSDAMNLLAYYLGVDDLMNLDNNLLKMLELTEKYYNTEFDRIN